MPVIYALEIYYTLEDRIDQLPIIMIDHSWHFIRGNFAVEKIVEKIIMENEWKK